MTTKTILRKTTENKKRVSARRNVVGLAERLYPQGASGDVDVRVPAAEKKKKGKERNRRQAEPTGYLGPSTLVTNGSAPAACNYSPTVESQTVTRYEIAARKTELKRRIAAL